jgi:RNA polymerase sigma-70 factor (ECF subfamily)
LDTSDSKLIKGCEKGNRKAQNQLYQKYKATLFGICLRYANSREEAEDMLQEGFIKIFSDLYQYKPTGPLGGWMRRVVINVALQHIRKNKKFRIFENHAQIVAAYDPDLEIFKSNREEAILKIVQQLPDGYRIIFNLYVIEEFSHREIAEKLGISVSTSKSQYSRARAALRAMLEKNITTEEF